MIFGGSSVTAGHDSLFNESWPLVFEKRMKPVFNALNIDLDVTNIAQGSTQCIPYELCYNTQGGENADFIGWEQSFNCGREPSMFELIARVAGAQQALLYFAASGSTSVPDCHVSEVCYHCGVCPS